MFMGRWSMTHGWIDLIRTKLFRKNEFVSADARRFSNDHRTYEMLGGDGPQLNIKTPDRAITMPRTKEYEIGALKSSDPYATVRAYTTPIQSFSGHRPPTTTLHKDWDSKATYAQPMTTKEFDLKISQLPD